MKETTIQGKQKDNLISQETCPDKKKPYLNWLKWNNRAIHRDLGYFYLGLIISFSLSGILLNHRLDWHLDQYTVSSREVSVDFKQNIPQMDTTGKLSGAINNEGRGVTRRHQVRHGEPGSNGSDYQGRSQGGSTMIPEKFASDFAQQFGITDSLRRQFIQKGKIRLSFAHHTAEINIKTGKGKITEFKKTPILSQMVQLHRTNYSAWVWFSDCFAISLIVISITGVILPRGKNSFSKRGWILTIAGLVFPLIILTLLV